MSIWIFSRDISFFDKNIDGSVENTLERHIVYFKNIHEINNINNIHVYVITSNFKKFKDNEITPGFYIKRLNLSILSLVNFIFRCWKKNIELPELITTQTPFLDGLLGFFIGTFNKIPVMVQLHFDITSNDWRKERMLNSILYLIGKHVLSNSTYIRVVSNTLKSKLVQVLKFKNTKKIFVMPVSINAIYLKNKERNYRQENIYRIYAIGRLVESKNFNLFLEVAEKFKGNYKYKFILVGDGPLKNKLKKAASAKKLDNIEFIGYKSPEKMIEIYKNADLILVTSKHEGYCRVVEESLSFSIPVISTACVGPEDMISNDINGYVIYSRNANAFSEKIKIITETKEIYYKFSKAAFLSDPRKNYQYNNFGDLLSQIHKECIRIKKN